MDNYGRSSRRPGEVQRPPRNPSQPVQNPASRRPGAANSASRPAGTQTRRPSSAQANRQNMRAPGQRPADRSARPADIRYGQAPASPAAGRTAPNGRRAPKSRSPRRHSLVFKLAVPLAAVVLVLIILNQFRSVGSSSDIMGLFETAPTDVKADPQDISSAPEKNVYAAYTEKTETLEIDSRYGILIRLKDNTVAASKNGDERIYPASMTKIMTLIVAYEKIDSMDEAFTFDFDIVNDAYLAGASVAGFSVGETVPVKDLLYGTVLPSGADATVALAKYVAGSEKAFAELMNEKAAALGLKNTHFVNSSGLHDDNHYSTCHDMALILKYAASIPELKGILGTYTYTTTPTEQHPEGITLYSTMYRKMAGTEAEGVYIQGGKTGYTNEARHCLASFAAACTEEDSPYTAPQYILVTAYGESEYKPIFDAINTYGKYISG